MTVTLMLLKSAKEFWVFSVASPGSVFLSNALAPAVPVFPGRVGCSD